LQIAVLYGVTVLVFLAADAVMLRTVMQPLFSRHLGDALLDSPRLGPAVVFYLFYVAGLLWLVSLPALRAGAPGQALLNGALLGAIAYGTYEFTNYATLRDWSWQQVAVDGLWGTVLTGVSAWAGVTVARMVAA
jgi:uncharacterized membrane protein